MVKLLSEFVWAQKTGPNIFKRKKNRLLVTRNFDHVDKSDHVEKQAHHMWEFILSTSMIKDQEKRASFGGGITVNIKIFILTCSIATDTSCEVSVS